MKVFASLALLMLGGCAQRAAGPQLEKAQQQTSAPLLATGDHQVAVNGHLLAYHVRGHGPLCVVHPGGPGFEWTYARIPEAEAKLTLIIAGRRDFVMATLYAEELQRTIPGAELVVLEQSGHMGQIEEPAAFTEALARFVAAHPTSLRAGAAAP